MKTLKYKSIIKTEVAASEKRFSGGIFFSLEGLGEFAEKFGVYGGLDAVKDSAGLVKSALGLAKFVKILAVYDCLELSGTLNNRPVRG